MSFWVEKLFHLLIHRKWNLDKGTFDPGQVQRILVVRNDNVGDVLCSTPAIRALRRAFPRAYLAALVVAYSRDAVTGNPDLDEVLVYEKAKHRPDRNHMVSLFKQLQVEWDLRRKGFDLVIGMRSSFSWSEAWIVYFTGAPFRLGYDPGVGKNHKFSFFYNLRVPKPPEQHEVEKALFLVQRIGVQPSEKSLKVFIPQEEKDRVDAFLKGNEIDPERLIGFHLSSRLPANGWGPEKFSELALRIIQEKGKTVILTWGPGDEGRAKEVQRRVGAGVFLYPTPNFKSLGAIQQRCRLFVSPDGGAMHFSTAVGTPTVGLFGKTDPRLWAPWGDGNIALRRGKESELISVDEVYKTMIGILSEGRKEVL
ncbi:MAG TPA: glycosyltransferase family 9 protein [Thermodesulfobacteriota bacterium]|nr:glycosyltransferase family 9 protein [Thermodesulfobacteriota bacterium]